MSEGCSFCEYQVGDERAFLISRNEDEDKGWAIWGSGPTDSKYFGVKCWDLEDWIHFTLQDPEVPKFGIHIFVVIEVGVGSCEYQYLWKIKENK